MDIFYLFPFLIAKTKIRPPVFGRYWINHPEIFHSYCLEFSEEPLLDLGSKYSEFSEKLRNLNFPECSVMSEICVISVSLCIHINICSLISLL